MRIGYARISTQDQTLDLQTDALQQAGCEKIFTDTMSGAKAERPGLDAALGHLRACDTLVVWRLDRLGRTLKHLIATVTDLSEQEIGFKSLQENIDDDLRGQAHLSHLRGTRRVRAGGDHRTDAGRAARRARPRTVRWSAKHTSA
jgi:DNA invertase Pin-like site-specific DNA recombinase